MPVRNARAPRCHGMPCRFTRYQLQRKGFTLLELLVVLLIIALLAGYVGPKLFGEVGKARTKTAASQMKSISSALDRYRLDTGKYPEGEVGLKALMTNEGNVPGWDGPYMTNEIPPDPWGRPYVYRVPGDNGKDYDLRTLGSDGKPGGTGEDLDVVAQ